MTSTYNLIGPLSHVISVEAEAAAQEEEDEMMSTYEVVPEFSVNIIAKHYIELLVSVSTPVDGQQSSATFLQV